MRFINFAPLVTGVGVCIETALVDSFRGVPPGFRVCYLVPTQQIPWDNCGCPDGGQLALAIQNVYGSNRFPTPADAAADWSKCGPRWQVAQVLVSVVRCVPTMDDQGQPPSCDAELLAALGLESDRQLVRQAIACCLENLKTNQPQAIGGWALGPSPVVGELGGCAGVETTFYVSMASCLCGS
jgi:hypothetical protein